MASIAIALMGPSWINWDPRINEDNTVGKTAELPAKTQFKVTVSGWQAN